MRHIIHHGVVPAAFALAQVPGSVQTSLAVAGVVLSRLLQRAKSELSWYVQRFDYG